MLLKTLPAGLVHRAIDMSIWSKICCAIMDERVSTELRACIFKAVGNKPMIPTMTKAKIPIATVTSTREKASPPRGGVVFTGSHR